MTAYMQHKDLSNVTIDAQHAASIAHGVHRVRETIAQACRQAGRNPTQVQLLAATKTRDVGEIMAAVDAGVRLIGENKPQEITAKLDGLTSLCAQRGLGFGAQGAGGPNRVDLHLIGQLQPNKINKVLPVVNAIESVDSIELAERIAKRAVAHSVTVGVLLEVNESGEASKSGCDPSRAVALASKIGVMGGIELRGLMTIGAHVTDEVTVRKGFAHLRHARDMILASGNPGTDHCHELSMGMTQDMVWAIAEGSTLVRVGTAIFGPRAFI